MRLARAWGIVSAANVNLKIQCGFCGAAYEVGLELVGHKVRCETCKHSFDVEVPDGLETEGEARVWRFQMPGGQKFGPVSKLELDEYLFEGVLTADCQVHKEGDDRKPLIE